jgi:dipeptidyl aminopeptidase/acylaminoacyl peptidase
MKISSFVFILLLTFIASAQETIPNASSLQLKEIMKGNGFIGNQPENVQWNIDGSSILFQWNPENNPGNSLYAIQVASKAKTPILQNNKDQVFYDQSQQAYWIQYESIDGCLVAYNKKTKSKNLIYQSSSPIYNIQRVNDPNLVFFQQANNLFCYDASKGSIRQVSNFINGDEKQKNTETNFLTQQQTELFQYIREKEERKEWFTNQNNPSYKLPDAYYLGKSTIENIQISKDGNYISFRISNYPTEVDTEVEHHITADGYSKISPARAKVGSEEATHFLGIYSIEKDTTYLVDFSKLTDIRKKAEYLNDTQAYDKDRKHIMHSLRFSSINSNAVCDIRSYDNKDRWIVLINLKDGSFTEIDQQHDEAWIGGPGISSWNMEEGTLGWLKDNKTVYFQSEETGYSHLYLYDIVSQKKEQRTKGNWEIYKIELSNDGNSFYVTCNKTHPGNRDFYRYDIAARKMVPILTKPGYHEVTLSPDEKTLAVRYSFKNKPWEIYTAANVSSTELMQITHSTSKQFDDYKWREPEVITFKGSDGKDVYARVYNPDSNKNSAAVIFVHGAGYLQNAHNYWSTYHREYMFHNMLVDNGYTVLDIDYRASEGYGRDYRTAIYRHMGGQDLQDQLSGKDYLVKQLGIDSTRIGIYGGSYGGFITLMAMLTTPTEFPCGAALRSVTDWAHYNHEYTSNILNYPDTDPEAYKKSSPIYYANQLQGKLLMLHGMVDDNVQFQDVVRLSQRFIELGKENWELAVFPVEAHGFKESYSWTDEYRRIYELFYNELILKSKK